MGLKYMTAISAAVCGVFLLNGCGTASSGGGTVLLTSGKVLVDLIEDYMVVRQDEVLTLGTGMVTSEIGGKRYFLDYTSDNGLDTTIITLDANGNGSARNAPSAGNSYDTNETVLLTWGVDTDGNLTAVVEAGSDTLDLLITPIEDPDWPSENILTEVYNRTVGDVETRYPALWSATNSFDAAAIYTANCAGCHDGSPGNVLDGEAADVMEVSMIRIKDDSVLTGNTTMNVSLDGYTVGQIRLLAEHIESLAP